MTFASNESFLSRFQKEMRGEAEIFPERAEYKKPQTPIKNKFDFKIHILILRFANFGI